MSLAGVLLASLVMSVLALGLVRLSVSHLWLSSRSNSRLAASSLANSTASAAVARLLEQPKYGPGDPAIELTTDQGVGVVTFSPSPGRPHSTNNLQGTEPVQGYDGKPVPAGSVHIVATADVRGARVTVEAALRVPAFPWAILTGGRLVTTDKVLIGTIPEGEWPPPPDSELLPADVLANAGGQRSIVLGGDCTITGDVESPGGIVVEGAEVKVKGEVRPGVAPVDVPVLRAARYDPKARETEYDDLRGVDSSSVLPLQGASRHQGDLEVAGLRLEGAHVFVDGNLTVRGGIKGTGTLICTGDVEVEELALDAANELAIVADGKVTLRGAGPTGSAVRGIFYAGDSLSARNLTVVGTVVAGNPSGEIALENARVLAEPITLPQPPVAGTIYVGKHYPPPLGQGGDGTAEIMTQTRERPSYRYAFSLDLGPPGPNNGYPRTIVIGPGFYATQSSRWTVHNARDVAKMEKWMSRFTYNGKLKRNTVGLPKGRQGTLTSIFLAAVSGGAGEDEDVPTVVNLKGDLSRFLPFEDRVRVVSWFER